MKDFLVGLAITVVVVVGLYAFAAFQLGVWAPWAIDKQTEVTRKTNSYITTKQQAINGYVRQYDQLGNYDQTPEVQRQRANIVYLICDDAQKIKEEFVPRPAIVLMEEEGCK